MKLVNWNIVSIFWPKKTIFLISKSYGTMQHGLSNDYIIKYMMTHVKYIALIIKNKRPDYKK